MLCMNLCQYIINASGIQEVALRNIIMLTVQDLTESTDGLADRYIFSFQTGELSCHEERLGQESLDLTGSGYDQLVFLGQFVHAEDGDNIL